MKYLNQPEANKEYMRRTGSYGLLMDRYNRLAVIKTSTGYFLPGGGLKDNENLESCLEREFKEEASIAVKVDEKLTAIGYYFYSTTLKTYMVSEGHFYTCHYENDLDNPHEEDHELIWLDLDKAANFLYLRNQQAAVNLLISQTDYSGLLKLKDDADEF